MKNIFIYRFKMESCDEEDCCIRTTNGYISALSYEDAMARIVKVCTAPNGKCDLVSVSLYEVDSWDGMGILTDDDIDDVMESNNNEKF